MNRFPIPLDLAIKNTIFIPRHHFPLDRHLSAPPLERFGRVACFGERGRDGADDGVDCAETFALPGFLGGGEAPGGFPVGGV